jgi:hypothetical protein
MKRSARLFLMLSIVVAAVFVSFGSPYIQNKFIAIPCCGSGLLPVAEIEIIQNLEELNAYFSQIGCNLSELSELPNFDSEMAFGVVTGFCNDHHTSCSRSPEGVIFRNDTFTLIIHSSSSVDSTQILPLGFCTMLITMDKSKLLPRATIPVAMKEAIPITAVKPKKTVQVMGLAHQATKRAYTILGRSLTTAKKHTSSIVIQINENCRVKRVLNVYHGDY